MGSKTTGRSLQNLIRRNRPKCECANSTPARTASVRQFSASTSRRESQYNTERAERPWLYTPSKMRAPFPVKVVDKYKRWECNNDSDKLDRFYAKFLGRGEESLLTDDVKWLAITHKSFDQGRRGFNDRLAFFGRRILNLQATLALLHSPTLTETQKLSKPIDGRVPYSHPALEGLANVSDLPLSDFLNKTKLAQLATQTGMPEILRWVPRLEDDLRASGIETVLATTVYAIIGAVALQSGGEVAARVARDRVLKPIGIA